MHYSIYVIIFVIGITFLNDRDICTTGKYINLGIKNRDVPNLGAWALLQQVIVCYKFTQYNRSQLSNA